MADFARGAQPTHDEWVLSATCYTDQ